MDAKTIIGSVGLLLDIVGVLLVFFRAYPQPLFEDGVGVLVIEDETPQPEYGGRTTKEVRAEQVRLRKKYKLLASTGLVCLVLGFSLQLWALWM